ncbi:MAG: glycosyl hydrolase [Chitinophagaceae bacterium]
MGSLFIALPSQQVAAQDHVSTYDQFRKGFNNPPQQAHPKSYWWWLNGNTDTARLMTELTAMKNAGIGGVDIFDIGARAPNNPNKMIPGGPAFMGPEALATLVKVIKKATGYNMEVGLSLSSSWNAGGSWITPEYAGKSLYYSTVKAQGPGLQRITVPFPTISKLDEKGKARVIVNNAQGKPVYSKEVVVLAYPSGDNRSYGDTSKIINVSAFFDSGRDELNWTVPEGSWDIQRFVCANSGEQLKYYSDNSAGPIIDHFDSSAARFHFMYFIDHLKPLLGDFTKTALKYFYLASFEATGSVWTPTLPSEFKKLNGYEVYKFLPAIFNTKMFDTVVNEKFKHDFDKTISELMIRNHYGKGKEIANSYGLKLISEAGGPGPPLHNVPVEAIKALGALDIPRGEFWNKHYVYDKDSIDLLMLVKEVSASAHMYHRKIVEEESFTSFQHWTEGPFDLKPLGDRAFCEGMNRVVVHGFSHNPAVYGFPGIVYHAGTHFNDKTVWWSKTKPFVDYLARISFVMQETQFVSDVLYYYGDNVPNFVTPKNTRFSAGAGYDYDIINTDVLLRELAVKNGMLVLPGGASFHVLALGNMESANPAAVKKLKELASQGANITGASPISATGLLDQPGADATMKKTANALWVKPGTSFSKEQLGKGKIFSDISPPEILAALAVKPDFVYDDKQSTVLDYIHQKQGELDFYLVRNTTDQWISRFCTFRQKGKIPEIWDPVSGEIAPVNIYNQQSSQLSMPVSFAPFQSFIIVFKNQVQGSRYTDLIRSKSYPPKIRYFATGLQFLENGVFELNSTKDKREVKVKNVTQPIEGPWKIRFSKNWGAPDSASFPKLISWTESENLGIRYFSGTATYNKTFSYSNNLSVSGERVYLDLGDLSKVGEAWLNGHSLGITWAMPFRFDITGLIKNGENTLRIEIANVWANRIVGDAITGEKFTSTNLPGSAAGVSWAQTPLVRSGLLGPVTIQRVGVVK